MTKEKYPNSLVTKAHKLAFKTEVPNKEIAKKLKLTDRQLRYVLYKLKPQPTPHEMYINHYYEEVTDKIDQALEAERKPTITESFLDFFIADKFR